MTRLPEFAPFRVFEACRQGAFLVATHARAMARLGRLPLAILCANALVISQMNGPISPLENFIYGLPGLGAAGYMIFVCVRLWLLDETPRNPLTDRATRARLLQATVITYVMWKALMAGYEYIFLTIANPAEILQNPDALQNRTGVQFTVMVMLGVVLWALRYRLAPVLTAVDYPLRDYVRRATGFMVSLRLLGIVLICVEFPKILILTPLMHKDVPTALFLVVGNAVTFILELWLFAAFAAALKEMMGKQRA